MQIDYPKWRSHMVTSTCRGGFHVYPDCCAFILFSSLCVRMCASFFFSFPFFKIIHLFTYACIVWVISLPSPSSTLLSPFPPHFQAEPILPLSLILLKKRHKHNKEDKVFLLVELRIAIQRDS
jgi:hypothetical protein